MVTKPEPFYRANLRCFERHFPGVARAIKAVGQPLSTLVWEDGAAVDIDLGKGRLYKMPAAAFAREQLDLYFARPERVILNNPEGAYLVSPVSIRLWNFITDRIAARRITTLLPQPKDVIGYALIIGVGLGLHLEELIERTNARHVIVVEPIAEFLAHSLHAVDWKRLVGRCRRRGIALHFVLGQHPERLNAQVLQIIQENGIPFLDGSYIYTHYQTWITTELRSKFKESAVHLMVAKGFYEDEVKMIENTLGNFLHHQFHLIDGGPRLRRKEPAFIVASGPSIDDCIGTIKKWKDHAVIFSSGSSLQLLLHHGIVPDYHVEIENVPELVDMLQHILDESRHLFAGGKFAGLPLIASCTVDPKVPPFFAETYFFFRDSVSSSYTFGADFRKISGVGPNVTNTSLTLAAVLGFHQIYLFGTDCGVRSQTRHHAKHTVHHTDERFMRVSMPCEFTYPGNFGGVVQTDLLLEWSRGILEHIIQIYRLTAYNCSDGALIESAIPRVHDTVAFSTPPLDNAAIHREIREKSYRLGAGEFFRDHDAARYVDGCARMLADFRELLERAREEDENFEEFYARLTQFLGAADGKYAGVSRMIAGSAAGIPRVAAFYINRLEDLAVRKELFAEFLAEFTSLIEDMCVDARGIFERITTRDLAQGPAVAAGERPAEAGTA